MEPPKMKLVNFAYSQVKAEGVAVLIECPPVPLYITLWWFASGERSSITRKTRRGGDAVFRRITKRMHEQT